MKDTYSFAILADIHNGIYTPSEYYHKEISPMISKLENIEMIDAIFIAGDLNEKNYPLGSEEAKYMMIIIARLCKISLNKGTKIRVIKGTRYHDGEQLEALRYLELDENINFRIIDKVEDELLFDNIKVLYIPEEYVESKEEYYKDYFNRDCEYDLIIVHGLFEKAAHYIKESESETHIQKAPVFTTADITKCLKGVCVAGHIHKHMIIDECICYVGSMSRNGHGEEEDKGMVLVGYDTIQEDFFINFIKNENARVYKTVKVGKAFNNISVEEMIQYIEDIKEVFKCDYLRVDIIPNEIDAKTKANMALLRDYYRRNRYISIRQLEKKSKIKEVIEDELEEDDSVLKYGYLFDGTDIDIQLLKFAKDNFNVDLKLDEIKEELNTK